MAVGPLLGGAPTDSLGWESIRPVKVRMGRRGRDHGKRVAVLAWLPSTTVIASFARRRGRRP
jgi:hypothetical protein